MLGTANLHFLKVCGLKFFNSASVTISHCVAYMCVLEIFVQSQGKKMCLINGLQQRLSVIDERG